MRTREQEVARFTWMRTAAVAKRLDVSRAHVVDLVQAGAFPDVDGQPGAINVGLDALTREELAARTDYEVAGRFNNLVGSLRTAGAIEYPTKGQVRATDLLFPEELPS